MANRVLREMRQLCKKCGGTGVSKTILTDDAGRTLLAPTYHKGEGDRPQFVPCKECEGSGMTLQPPPVEILVDGEKLKLDPAEAKARYSLEY